MANFLFADGHVKADRFDKMKYRNFCNLPDGDAKLDQPVTNAITWVYRANGSYWARARQSSPRPVRLFLSYRVTPRRLPFG